MRGSSLQSIAVCPSCVHRRHLGARCPFVPHSSEWFLLTMNSRRCGDFLASNYHPFPFFQIFFHIGKWLNRYCPMDSILCRGIRSGNLERQVERRRANEMFIRVTNAYNDSDGCSREGCVRVTHTSLAYSYVSVYLCYFCSVLSSSILSNAVHLILLDNLNLPLNYRDIPPLPAFLLRRIRGCHLFSRRLVLPGRLLSRSLVCLHEPWPTGCSR
jgi:hypothetical protein